MRPAGAAFARAIMPAFTGAAWAPRGVHLLQLFQLVGRQDLFDFSLHVGFEVRQLLFLVLGKVELLGRTGWQDMKPARLVSRTASLRGRASGVLCVTDGCHQSDGKGDEYGFYFHFVC